MVQTADFPQADRLEQVGGVATAISKGWHADSDIEDFIGLDSGGRQGRYYRLAAETLGLIQNSQNHAVLTPLGDEYAKLTTKAAQKEFLAQCLLETEVFQTGLQYIQDQKPDYAKLQTWFKGYYPGAAGTAGRRFATFFSYITDTGLVGLSGSGYVVKKFQGAVVKQKSKSTTTLAGKAATKTTTNAPPMSGTGVIQFEVSEQKRERANHTHWKLVAAKSAFLATKGLPAFENPQVDLFSRAGSDVVMYEMKSVASSNLHAQARKAISQLYEYRYIFSEPSARLCIVTNTPISKADAWLVDYLAKDRLIAYEWTEDFSQFQCEKSSVPLLGPFAI